MSIAAEAFRKQEFHCRNLGSAFTADLCLLFAEHLTPDTIVGNRVHSWAGNPSHRSDAVPLRLIGGLHALVLSGQDEELVQAYPPHTNDVPSWSLIERVLKQHSDFLLEWLKSPPQTNEVQRSNAIWPALQTIAATTKLPIALWEVGASAGLNLQMDRFSFNHGGVVSGVEDSPVQLTPDWEGPLPPVHEVEIVEKAACDLNPLDPSLPEDRLRLLSYVWAGQTDRVERTAGAIDLARRHPVAIDKQDGVLWLKDRLANRLDGVCTVIFTTIAWQYLPDEAKSEGEAMMLEAGLKATKQSPLAELHLEGVGEVPGAAITLKLWPYDIDTHLGRADFHGRWVKWETESGLLD